MRISFDDDRDREEFISRVAKEFAEQMDEVVSDIVKERVADQVDSAIEGIVDGKVRPLVEEALAGAPFRMHDRYGNPSGPEMTLAEWTRKLATDWLTGKADGYGSESNLQRLLSTHLNTTLYTEMRKDIDEARVQVKKFVEDATIGKIRESIIAVIGVGGR